MNILVLSAYTDNIKDYGELTSNNHLKYSNKHNYDYISVTTGFYENINPAWSKIKFITEHISTYDYVFWIDADALIMRYDIELESFLEHYTQYDMIFNLEHWWSTNNFTKFNTGLFFIKNTAFSLSFLDEVIKQKNATLRWLEQSAIWNLYNDNYLDSLYKIKIFPWTTFNSFYHNVGNDSETKVYTKGDFICHFAGVSNNDRITHIKEYLNYVKH